MGTFSLLTLNCFGGLALGTQARLRHLAQTLNSAAYSMVCLQEVQSNRYRALLARDCNTCYPAQVYQQFVHAPKGGLLTLSRLPIDQREFALFRNRGLWYTPAVMDWITHKGVLITHTHIDDLPIVIMNTHLTANYTGNWGRENVFAQKEHDELTQIAALVNAQPADRLVIVCGDFNVPRGTWLYDALIADAALIDPLTGDQRPTFRPYRGMGKHYGVPIDFTLYRAPAALALQVESDLRFQDKVNIDGRPVHLSDHVGIATRFSWGSQ